MKTELKNRNRLNYKNGRTSEKAEFSGRHRSSTQIRTLLGRSGTLRLGVRISGKMHLIIINPKIP